MNIYNLNYDTLLNIFIFLDLESLHKLKLVNSIFYKYFSLSYKNISYIGILYQNSKEIKKSYIVNPNYKTFQLLCKFKNSKKIFKNHFGKKMRIF